MEIQDSRQHKVMRLRNNIVSILAVGLLLTACHAKEEMSYSANPMDNIEALWQIIDTRYCYIEDKGIDWDAIHDRYIRRAQFVKKNDQVGLFDLCASMLDSLRDGHVNLYAAFDVSRNTAWYDTFPANFDARLQSLYLRNYRVAGSLYYCTVDEGRVGYVYYSSFSNSFGSGHLAWVFAAFKQCKGIIIDVRNNGGGSLENANRSSTYCNQRTDPNRQKQIHLI